MRLGNPSDSGLPGWPTGRALDLKEFPIPGEIADSDWARWWWRSAPALGLVSLLLQLDKLRKPDDQSSEFLCLIIGQPLVRDGDGVRRLSYTWASARPLASVTR
jgi:hypothetical protein